MYDFDKIKPISVSEIQLPYLYLYLTMVGIFIYDNPAETIVSHVSMYIANMHFSINDFRMVSRLDKNAGFFSDSLQKNSISIC